MPSGSSPASAPGLCSRPGRRAEADRPGVEALHKLRGGVPGLAVRSARLAAGPVSPVPFDEFAVAGHGPPELVKLLRAMSSGTSQPWTGGSSRPHGAGSSRTRPASRCGTRPNQPADQRPRASGPGPNPGARAGLRARPRLYGRDMPEAPAPVHAGLPRIRGACWLGAVGNRLRVLLDTNAVLHRRTGHQVLYWRTSLSDALAVPLSPSPAQVGRQTGPRLPWRNEAASRAGQLAARPWPRA